MQSSPFDISPAQPLNSFSSINGGHLWTVLLQEMKSSVFLEPAPPASLTCLNLDKSKYNYRYLELEL